MIFEDILLSVLDFAGFSSFSLPLSFINGFRHIIGYVFLLDQVFPVLTAIKTCLLIAKFSLVCGILKMILRKIF